jgi:hypothetical protein
VVEINVGGVVVVEADESVEAVAGVATEGVVAASK